MHRPTQQKQVAPSRLPADADPATSQSKPVTGTNRLLLAILLLYPLLCTTHLQAQALRLNCQAAPTRVYPGEQVTATGTLLGAPADHSPAWSWQTNGGQVVNIDNTATVSTAGLAPGEYTIVGRASLGKRHEDQASCSALFVVRSFDPPTASCAASPTSVVAGAEAMVTMTATSPQHRPLSYEFTSSTGVLVSDGATARLSTTGLAPTGVAITCKVTDDLGHSTITGTQIAVTAPAPPVPPRIEELCILSFTRDPRRPVRVDNEAKGCLDDVALTLNHQADARLVMVGNASPDERPEAAAQRVLNARQYLTRERGIDPARIEVRVGETSGPTVSNFLLPRGAVFQDPFTQRFDERSVKRQGEAYGKPGAKKASVARPAAPMPSPAPPPGQVPKPAVPPSH